MEVIKELSLIPDFKEFTVKKMKQQKNLGDDTLCVIKPQIIKYTLHKLRKFR